MTRCVKDWLFVKPIIFWLRVLFVETSFISFSQRFACVVLSFAFCEIFVHSKIFFPVSCFTKIFSVCLPTNHVS